MSGRGKIWAILRYSLMARIEGYEEDVKSLLTEAG